METTKREILASVTIIAIMFLIGFVVAGKIEDYQIEKNSEYYKAALITDTDMFRYGMDTSIGNAFVYGDLEAVDKITYPEIGNEYLYMKKVEEHYNMHTRTVTTRVNGKTHTRTEVYWSWDYAGSEEIHSKKIRFCGIEMDYGKVSRPGADYIDTIQTSSHVRYKYYGCKPLYSGTVYSDLRGGTISDGSAFYPGKDIATTIECLTATKMWIFWLIWFLLTGGTVIGFYYLDNNWLEG